MPKKLLKWLFYPLIFFSIYLIFGQFHLTQAFVSPDPGEFALVYNPNKNEYFLVWAEVTPGNGIDIWGKRLNAHGQPFCTKIFKIFEGDGDQRTPAIGYNPRTREYLILWSGPGDKEIDVFGIRIEDEEYEKVSPVLAVLTLEETQQEPALIYLEGKDQYLLAWADNRKGDEDLDIYGSRLSGNGEKLGSEFVLAKGSGNQRLPDLQTNLLVFTQEMEKEAKVKGQRLNANGWPFGRAYDLNRSSDYQINAATSPKLVVWTNFNALQDILGKRINEAGSPWGAVINETEKETALFAEVEYNPQEREHVLIFLELRGDEFGLSKKQLNEHGIPITPAYPIF